MGKHEVQVVIDVTGHHRVIDLCGTFDVIGEAKSVDGFFYVSAHVLWYF